MRLSLIIQICATGNRLYVYGKNSLLKYELATILHTYKSCTYIIKARI